MSASPFSGLFKIWVKNNLINLNRSKNAVKKARFTGNQSIAALKKREFGMKTADAFRGYGIRDAAFNNWITRYGGLQKTNLSAA